MPTLPAEILDAPRFREIFDLAVAGHARGLPPSVADVTRTLGLTASTIHQRVQLLQERGYIELVGERNRTRAILLTEKSLARVDLRPRPADSEPYFEPSTAFQFDALANPSQCGSPRYAAPDDLQNLNMIHLFRGWRDGDRVIIARGDSMEHPYDEMVSICDEDLVWGRPAIKPAPGEIVYVEYSLPSGDVESTIKQFNLDEKTGTVRLHPLNPDYPDIIRRAEDVTVAAVVLGVRRLVERPK